MHAAAIDPTARERRALAARIAGLYAVTPDAIATDELVVRVAAALDGGAAVVQYRNKRADAALTRTQAAALASIVRARGRLFIVNDDAALAAAVDADGVHVGEDDGSIAAARALVGEKRVVGASCYNDLARAERAIAEGADYVAFGSFHASSVKPQARRADVALLARASRLGVPVVAIGGITAENAGALFAAGADAVAVISDVFGAPHVVGVERAARALAATASHRNA